jgi:uncharacterized membrane protein
MTTLNALAVSAVALLTTGATWAQSGNMMNGGGWGSGWMGGGYGGGVWMILLAVVVIGVIAWIVTRGRK